jgi:hypothetical protein
MRIRPRIRFSFRFKKSIDHDGVALIGSSSGAARCFAAGPVSTAVHGPSGKNFASIRNSLRIDGAMADAQTSAGAGVFAGRSVTGCPVTGDAGQDRFLARKSGGCQTTIKI